MITVSGLIPTGDEKPTACNPSSRCPQAAQHPPDMPLPPTLGCVLTPNALGSVESIKAALLMFSINYILLVYKSDNGGKG